MLSAAVETNQSANLIALLTTIMSESENYRIGISKEELSQMPAAHFGGEIRVIEKPEEIGDALSVLKNAGTIGFDTETRPVFQKGHAHSVALLQLSTESQCFLFRLNMFGLTDEIKAILEDPDIMKIGLSTHDDFLNLNRLSPLKPEGFFELQNYVSQFRIDDRSLTKIYGILFGQRISKGQRLTNWEAPELSVHQQAYAALDAFACLHIYRYLSEGHFKPDDCPFKIYQE